MLWLRKCPEISESYEFVIRSQVVVPQSFLAVPPQIIACEQKSPFVGFLRVTFIVKITSAYPITPPSGKQQYLPNENDEGKRGRGNSNHFLASLKYKKQNKTKNNPSSLRGLGSEEQVIVSPVWRLTTPLQPRTSD